MDDWTPSTTQDFISKFNTTGNQVSFRTYISSTGTPHLLWSTDGSTTIDKGATTNLSAIPDGQTIWVRFTLDVNNGASGNDVKFYYASDSATVPVSWTQLGSTVTTAGVTSVFNSTTPVEIGSRTGGTQSNLVGEVFRGQIYTGILGSGGTLAADFDPSRAASTASTNFVAVTGETWTRNGTSSFLGSTSATFGPTQNTFSTASSFTQSVNITNTFQVQSGVDAVFYVDTTSKQVQIGSSSTDNNAVLLILDSYNTAADPTGVDGAMYYNSSTRSFRCYSNGAWRGCVSGVVFAATTASNTISGTTADTAFNQTYTIPANDCQPGRAYRILATGLMSTQGGLAGQSNLMMRVKLGSTVIADSPSSASGNSLANRQWRINAQFTCTSAGVSGTVESGGTFTHYTSNIASVDWEMIPSSNPVTVNTTTSQTLQITAQWNSTNAANSIIMRQFIVDAGGN